MNYADEGQTKRYFEKKSKEEALLIQEKTYWKKMAKSFWLAEGNLNSKFFHAYATTRKKRSYISRLRTDNGEVITDHEGMREVVK